MVQTRGIYVSQGRRGIKVDIAWLVIVGAVGWFDYQPAECSHVVSARSMTNFSLARQARVNGHQIYIK